MVHHGDGHVADLHHGRKVNLLNIVEDQLAIIILHRQVLDMVEILVVDIWVVLVVDT